MIVFSEWLRKRMFFLVLITTTILFLLGGTNVSNFGINKTVGWQWDIANWLPFIKAPSMMVVLVVYGVLMVLKKETNTSLSISHLVMIWILGLLDIFYSTESKYIFFLYIVSLLIFVVNVTLAFVPKKIENS